ncbi:YbjQ family protein [Thermodesulfobacteriota bacterium]
MDFIVLITLIALGYFAGTWAEKRHYRSIERRETAYLHLPAITTKNVSVNESKVREVKIVYGSAVISIDYFKRILAGLRNIFGGTIKSYETLLDRARREALLRMKEMATDATMIINVRIETSAIGKTKRNKNIGCLEAVAYGTALYIDE